MLYRSTTGADLNIPPANRLESFRAIEVGSGASELTTSGEFASNGLMGMRFELKSWNTINENFYEKSEISAYSSR